MRTRKIKQKKQTRPFRLTKKVHGSIPNAAPFRTPIPSTPATKGHLLDQLACSNIQQTRTHVYKRPWKSLLFNVTFTLHKKCLVALRLVGVVGAVKKSSLAFFLLPSVPAPRRRPVCNRHKERHSFACPLDPHPGGCLVGVAFVPFHTLLLYPGTPLAQANP